MIRRDSLTRTRGSRGTELSGSRTEPSGTAIKNFRFNESPIAMLNNVDALGRPVRTGRHLIPPMRILYFNFSSLTDAV